MPDAAHPDRPVGSVGPRRRAAVDVDALVSGVVAGNRADIARAITLVESRRDDHRTAARVLLERLAASGHPASRDGTASTSLTVRVGISGVPGVGKSTFIETLGRHLLANGHRVGVLAVDPSSVRTGGSVLGDKTRMAALAADPRAFIRPSPSAGTLGGVARATAQAMSVLEAAGHDVVIVETVGVGQSEVTVAGMVDTFLFLTLARTGDQLQGIKKGIVEIADVVAVNKADEERENEAKVAARQLAGALRLVHGPAEWAPPVVTCSALTDVGVTHVWEKVLAHREYVGPAGIARRRAAQQLDLAWALVRDELDRRLLHSAGVERVRGEVREAVLLGELSAPAAADRILAAWDEASTHQQ
ncbi:ATPase/protein kinase [Humibacillus sp. DSM 29435]|nr:ATPase/protein kinase [Humibacillus sp. DSM 29435]